MDEGRLKVVKKRRDYNRRFVHMMNYLQSKRMDQYNSYVTTEQQEVRSKFVSDALTIKRNIVRNSWLKKFLKVKKQQNLRSAVNLNYGAYQGRSLESFSREIDRAITWNHPRLRRMRKVEEAKDCGVEIGAVLDHDGMRYKMDNFYKRWSDRVEAVDAKNKKMSNSTDMATNKIVMNPLEDISFFLHHGMPNKQPVVQKLGPIGRLILPDCSQPRQVKASTPKENATTTSPKPEKLQLESPRPRSLKSPVKPLPPIPSSDRDEDQTLPTPGSAKSILTPAKEVPMPTSRSRKVSPKPKKGKITLHLDTKQSKDFSPKDESLSLDVSSSRTPKGKQQTVKLIMSGRTKEETRSETRALPPVKEKRNIADLLNRMDGSDAKGLSNRMEGSDAKGLSNRTERSDAKGLSNRMERSDTKGLSNRTEGSNVRGERSEGQEDEKNNEVLPGKLSRVPTLVLPPIETSKELMKSLKSDTNNT